ncbi:D-glycero-beta-D-manno-heptose 1-phosphate adenylyltransferase [Fusobacterium sp. PH5-44]|uniref:D-glycero-beta-D-manno-heptose 1-phosphate adenylyltransferase n=1 Tax=unclassified Fusobacterium TaxID=2648384 RepID=UPI003D1A64A2
MTITQETAMTIVEELKKEGKTVVFTNGCFDILHVGHLRYLSEAKKQGDILIVGINSDSSVRILKGNERPINSELDRAEIISALKPVDFTVIFTEETPMELLDKIKPSIHVKGGDYTKELLPETPIVERNGGKVVILSFVEGKSTTQIVNKIQENKLNKSDKNEETS